MLDGVDITSNLQNLSWALALTTISYSLVVWLIWLFKSKEERKAFRSKYMLPRWIVILIMLFWAFFLYRHSLIPLSYCEDCWTFWGPFRHRFGEDFLLDLFI